MKNKEGISSLTGIITILTLGFIAIGGILAYQYFLIIKQSERLSAIEMALDETPVVTIKGIIADPNSFLNETVRVSGKLMNDGDYKSNPNFFITDGTNAFSVTAWLSLEHSPSLSNSSEKPAKIMSDYLKKTVTLKGIVKKNIDSFYLEVDSLVSSR